MNTYDLKRIKTNYPVNLSIIIGSTPVLFFGNIQDSRVATLGLNPSKNEFLDKNNNFLLGNKRRLENLHSLNASSLNNLNNQQVNAVFNGCLNYFFSGNAYTKWFNQLDNYVLNQSRLKVSYYKGTACHLDIVQWATNPVWGNLNQVTQNQLLKNDIYYLNTQLSSYPIQTLLINGRGALNYFYQYFSNSLTLVRNQILRTSNYSTNVFEYDLNLRFKTVKVLAWSCNFQSSRGLTNQMKLLISNWI